MPSDHLVLISDRDALAWVLSNARMAFASNRRRAAEALRVGDNLLLYTTRGCFHNPTRDRGRVIGAATVGSLVVQLQEPVVFGDREFAYGCDLLIEHLAPFGEGVVMAELVDELRLFPKPAAWSAVLRRSLVPLERQDAELLRRRLRNCAIEPSTALAGYLERSPAFR